MKVTSVNSSSFHPKYRADIDGLRAIAVLAVVMFHAFPKNLVGGFVGVDVFFVISGFLISTIIMKDLAVDGFSFFDFYGRRIKRIFPALLIVLVFSVSFGWFALLADEYAQLGKHIVAGVGFASNIVLFRESDYFDYSGETKPLLHLWSLGVEEQFYIIWPLVLWGVWRWHRITLPCLIVLLLASFFGGLKSLSEDSSAAFYLFHNRAWELIVGAILAWCVVRGRQGMVCSRLRAKLNDLLSVVGAGVILASIIFIGKDNFPGWWACLPVLGACLIIYAGKDAAFNRIVLSNRIAVWFGLISFPLYLWHWPLLSFARVLESDTPSAEIRLAAVALSIFLAWLTYCFIEIPLRNKFSSKAKIFSLSVLMACVGSVGYAIFKLDGIPQRGSLEGIRDVQAELEFKMKRGEAWICKDYPASDCIYSDIPDGIVLGDSHGPRIYAGLKDVYAEKGMKLASFGGRGGCLPFYNVASKPGPGVDKVKCHESVSKAIDKILTMPEIKRVVIVNRGPLYTSGKGFGGFAGDYFTDWSIALGGNFDSGMTNTEVFREGLKNTLDILVKANKEVVYVHNVPELGFDIKSCVEARPIRLTGVFRSPCAVSKEAFLKRNSEHRRLVEEILAQFPQVGQLDPSKILCDEKYCYGRKDGRFLYSDDDHLSDYGSTVLAEGLREQMLW